MVTGLGFALASRFSYIPAPLSYPYSKQIYVSQDHHAFIFFCSPFAHEIADSWIPHRGLDLTVVGWTCAINRFLWIFIG
ncbi:hypothetical protein C8J56DRAFT_1172518 [Mycena floridula]|nr:hypothetical protein C8J56DRAFT_1172518 [Mycena floridula]